MQIAYTAHTETCTLLLDAEGICRSVQAASTGGGRGQGRPARIPSSAEKCIGAQFVACIDLREAGGMIPLPRPGAQMLFARTEKNGRITLVRSAPVLTFVSHAAQALEAVESGVHAKPTVSYGADDELTIPNEPVAPQRRSSLPPQRPSGIVPAGTAARATIPPPPPPPRMSRPPRPSYASPPSYSPASDQAITAPRRPSLARVSAPAWDVDTTKPFKRVARR